MIYTIKEGKHSAKGLHHEFVWKKTMGRYMLIFDSKCVHTQKDHDWSKVCGWACNIFPLKPWFKGKPAHHVSSTRIAARYWSDGVELGLYTYVNHKRKASVFPSRLTYDIPYFVGMGYAHEQFYLEGLKGDIKFSRCQQLVGKINLGLGYKLYPWYGGDHPAPQEMEIFVHEF